MEILECIKKQERPHLFPAQKPRTVSSYRNPAPKPRAPTRATSPANPLAVGSSVHAISAVQSESARVCRPVSWKPELSRIVATRSARELFCLAHAGPGPCEATWMCGGPEARGRPLPPLRSAQRGPPARRRGRVERRAGP